MNRSVAGCCKSSRLPQPELEVLPRKASLPQATPLDRLLRAPQPRHMFVEGCTCGTGVIGCCPCTLGLAGRSMAVPGGAAGLHATSLILGGMGLYVGGRALRTNARALEATQAAGRAVSESARAAHVASQRAKAIEVPQAQEAGKILATLARGQNAMGQLIADSAQERRFDFWVTGVLQATTALALGLASATHLGLSVGFLPWMPVAGCLLTVYALAFCLRHLVRAYQSPRVLSDATIRMGGRAHADAYRDRSLARVRFDCVTGANWAVFALGQAVEVAAHLSLIAPLGPVAAAALPWALGASAVGAMIMTVQERFVPHVPLGPTMGPLLWSLGAKQRARLGASLLADERALQSLNAHLWSGASFSERVARIVESWVAPHCGPTAYKVLGDSVSRRTHAALQRDNGDTFALRAYVLATSQREAARLGEDAFYERERVRASLAALGPEESFEPNACGPLVMAAAVLKERASLLEDELARQHAFKHVVEILTPEKPLEGEDWTEARLWFLLARGQLGELITDDMIAASPLDFAPAVGPSRFTAAGLCVREESRRAVFTKLEPTIDRDFVRLVCNAHRARATGDAFFLGYEVALLDAPKNAETVARACCSV